MDAAASYADSGSGTPENKLHFLDYWRIIRMRKLIIFMVFVLVVTTTTLLTQWIEPTFMSTVRMDVQKDTSDISPLAPQQIQMGYDPYFVMTQFEIIQSKEVLYKVIDDLKLVQRWNQKYLLGESKLKAFEMLQKIIDPRNVRNTSIIEINVYSKDKAEAAEIANKIAEVYKTNRDELRTRLVDEGIKTLKIKLAEHDGFVELAKSNVNWVLKDKGIVVTFEGGNSMTSLDVETLRQLDNELVSLRTVLTRQQTRFDELKKLKQEDLRNAIGVIQKDELLDRGLEKLNVARQEFISKSKDLGPLNVEYVRMKDGITELSDQVDKRTAAVMLGLEADLKATQKTVDERTQKLEEEKKKNLDFAVNKRLYQQAREELDRQMRLRETVDTKIKVEEIDKVIKRSSAVRIIDIAEAAVKAAYPKMKLNVALGALVGLILGIGLAFFIEYLDTSVKTIDDVERALQAPVLAVIPQNVGALLEEGMDSPHAEAYRVLRTNILFTRKDENANAITVVSGGAGEGKSTTVLNLATIFAQNGSKVLLVDSDLRRPSLHKRLGLSNSLGLTNYLLGQNKLEEVVQTTALPNLHFLPSGRLPSSALGILNSAQMKNFITDAKSRYDFVFFDAPPIMGVSDATVLASGADLSLLVIQYRKYPQTLAIRARQMVDKVGGRLLGVVLNNINLASDSSYYYYSGYHYHSNNNADEPPTNGAPTGKAERRKSSVSTDAPASIKSKY
ncbi:MAG: polysaccharide biosynthesis tyrosine autokinase [Proteobacteria bacterium]|nr:polysaccharide biosynthesis tyrosine autokinase [Pseudomonadota bacterium]